MAKLWTVFPKLLAWPPARDVAHLVERLSLVPLVAGSIFMLATGLINTASWAPGTFNFTAAHFWTALITIGALITHIGAQLPVTRRALSRSARREPEPPGTGLTRRGMLISVAAAAGVATITTVGQTVRPLRELALLAPRHPDIGPQGIPVNKSAVGARVVDAATSAHYTLTLVGRRAGAQTDPRRAARPSPPRGDTADRVRRGLERLGALARRARSRPRRDGRRPDGAEVVVRSLQKAGAYSQSRLNAPHVRHDDTLLALEVNGEPLHIDHGFPARLIAPNRPGVQQTKWVARAGGRMKRSRAFWPMAFAGTALSVYGLVGLLRDERVGDSMSWMTYFAGGLLAHDVVWAPLVAAGSVALVRVVPARVRAIVQGALVVTATVLLVAYPVVWGDGRLANNPSILPRDYPRNLVIVLACTWAVTGALVLRAVLGRRR